MDYKFSELDLQTFNGSTNAAILANWLKAVATFYKYANPLVTHSSQQPLQQSIHISQCPRSQLRSLTSNIQQEVENLLRGLSAVESPINIRQKYQKLIAHTYRLNRLN